MKLALRLLGRDWRAGELTLIFSALVVAVAAITTVSFFTDRVRQALTTQASQLLAADLVLISDHPIPALFANRASAAGLTLTSRWLFRAWWCRAKPINSRK